MDGVDEKKRSDKRMKRIDLSYSDNFILGNQFTEYDI